MKCDFKIMGVEERIENIKQTVNVLNLSMDDVFLDKEMRMNPLLSSLDVLRMPTEKGITHRCILQDDIILSDNFSDFVNKLIVIAPDAIYSLYSFTGYKPYRKEAKILKTGGKIWGPAVVIPLKYIDGILTLAKSVRDDYVHDDGFYSYFAKKNKIEILTTCPNAIQLANSSSFFNHKFTKTRTFSENPLIYDWILDKEDSLHVHQSIKDSEILKA
nr:MAG TPA: hypothetical protein [Caudoviricetes sp.]